LAPADAAWRPGPTRPGTPDRRGLAPLTDAESHFGTAAAGTARARNV